MSSSDVRSFVTATTAYPAGAVLTFDATSPVCYSVQQVDHELVLNKGTNTHAQLDAFVASKGQPSGLASLDGSAQVPALQLGNVGDTSAVSTITDRMATVAYVADYGAVPDGTTDCTAAIQAAIDSGKKVVRLGSGTYAIDGSLHYTGTAGITLIGDGMGRTVVQKRASTSGHMLDINGDYQKYDITISDITFDVNLTDSAIHATYVTRFRVERCAFLNIPFWGIHLGGADLTTTIVNFDCTFSDCRFDIITQTYEHLLIFNSENVSVHNCSFANGQTTAIGVGIYQNTSRVRVVGCRFDDMHIGAYYSLSTDDSQFVDCTFEHCDEAIQGANTSDNGAFGQTVSRGLVISGCMFRYSAGIAVRMDHVLGGVLSDCTFSYNVENSLVVGAGTSHIQITGCGFYNNNTSDAFHAIHPGILFQSPSTYHASIADCYFVDDTAAPAQRVPISFAGAGTADEVRISNCALNAYSSSPSVGAYDSAVLGDRVIVSNCSGVVRDALPPNITVVELVPSVNRPSAFSMGIGAGGYSATSTGVSNTSAGCRSLPNVTTGSQNTTVGDRSGGTLTDGSRNTFVGTDSDADFASGNDRIALGYAAVATADGQMAIAPAITHIKAAGLTAAADGTGTLLAVDASGNIRPTAGTNKTVSAIDTFANSKGQPNGLATLDATSKVPNAQLPPPTATLPGALLGDTEQTQTILGMEAAPDLRGETVGTHNVAVGYQALNAAVGGATTYDNTAVGTFGLSYLTEGAGNTGVGYDAGTGLTTGSVSTFIGNSAGTTKPDCVHAIALGSGAMADADGQLALSQYVTHVKGLGLAAAADGTGTLLAIDDATGIIRPTAGTNKTVAQLDTFVASKGQPDGLATLDSGGKVPHAQMPAPTSALPGALIGISDTKKTVLGQGAAPNLYGDSLMYCTAIGSNALSAYQTSGTDIAGTTAVGFSSLAQVTTGSVNTAVGDGSGQGTTTGTRNVYIGYLAGTSKSDVADSIAIGAQAIVDADAQLAFPDAITHAKLAGLGAAADGTGTLLAIDASGHVRMAGGTNNTVAEIDAFVASKGQPNGLAPLDGGSKVPATNLPDATTAAIGAVTGVTSASTTALGVGAFNATATGARNVAVGTGPLSAATSATDNIAIGSQALASMASNTSSVAIGSNALALHTGSACIAIGDSALSANTTGQYNTAIGDHALTATSTASGNTGYGYHALMAATSATNSTALGAATLEKATGGTNTAVGYRSLFNATTGTNNTGVGFQSGDTITTGARNTCIGDGADTNSATAADRIALGRNAVATADGQFALPAAITHLLMAGLGVHSTNAPIPLSIDSSGIVRKAPTPFFSSVALSTDFTGSSTNLTTFNNWDVKIHDTPSGFGSSFSTWTCPRDARVLVTFNFAFSCPAAINRYFQLVVAAVSTSNTPAPYVYNYGLDNYGGSYSFSASIQRALRQGDQLSWKWSMNGQQPAFQNTYTNWQISEIGPYPG